jgi:2-polyprenyl-3-methyl-5-hydroxy-6-metoxy-1,4-benzoquinol methylase
VSADRTQEYFHHYAGDFDALYGGRRGVLRGALNAWLRRSMKLRYLRTIEGCDPIEGRRVLDVGMGPGHYAIALARRGAAEVVGIDFAPGMIDLATRHAEAAGVSERCRFVDAEFLAFDPEARFDYVIVTGFMDYAHDARRVAAKAVAHATSRAFFSFPADGGFLAWQRKVRYRRRCALYLYRREAVDRVFQGIPGIDARIEKLARDYFVTVNRHG